MVPGAETGTPGNPRVIVKEPCHAGRYLAARCRRPLPPTRPVREGGRRAVTVLNIVAAILGIAAVVYLVIALIRPERF